MARKTKEKWIQKAIRSPGALRAQAAKEGAITEQGTISSSWLKKKASGSGTTARRARLAMTLKKLAKRKKK